LDWCGAAVKVVKRFQLMNRPVVENRCSTVKRQLNGVFQTGNIPVCQNVSGSSSSSHFAYWVLLLHVGIICLFYQSLYCCRICSMYII